MLILLIVQAYFVHPLWIQSLISGKAPLERNDDANKVSDVYVIISVN
jgi:hypothetical protein